MARLGTGAGRLAVIAVGVVLAVTVMRSLSWAAGDEGGGHHDPFADVVLSLAIILIIALLGRGIAERFNQPAVLGELLIGVVVGNVGYWLGDPSFILIMHLNEAGDLFDAVWTTGLGIEDAALEKYAGQELGPDHPVTKMFVLLSGVEAVPLIILGFAVWMFSSLGVLLLLFMVGLESSVEEMKKVGGPAMAVAVVGVVAPMALGLGATFLIVPEIPFTAHLFIAATLAATSVGITARVFKDLGKMATPEAKIILGAAVIDDVLGLIILAVVVGMVATGEVQLAEIARICLISAAFLGAILLFGPRLAGYGVPIFRVFEKRRLKLLYPLCLMFILSWLANLVGLAAIVGAFAAGLIITEKQFDGEKDAPTGESRQKIEQLIEPLESVFAPVFFVLMGMQVNLATFLNIDVLGLGCVLIVAAILGKAVSGIVAGGTVDKATVGIGMVPRGEVGLIFASVGKGLGVLGDGEFSAIVIMVIVTTLLTPLALKWSLARKG